MPETLDNQQVLDEDINLRMLAARRTTFEWVLRNTANPNVEIRTGLGVIGVLLLQFRKLPDSIMTVV